MFIPAGNLFSIDEYLVSIVINLWLLNLNLLFLCLMKANMEDCKCSSVEYYGHDFQFGSFKL